MVCGIVLNGLPTLHHLRIRVSVLRKRADFNVPIFTVSL